MLCSSSNPVIVAFSLSLQTPPPAHHYQLSKCWGLPYHDTAIALTIIMFTFGFQWSLAVVFQTSNLVEKARSGWQQWKEAFQERSPYKACSANCIAACTTVCFRRWRGRSFQLTTFIFLC